LDFFEKMSYCKESESGKDKIIFLSEEDAKKPSNVELKPAEEPVGMFTKEGDINWACPCLGSMPSGPCGVEFREAFECFHYSEAEPKGTDCLQKFMEMNECMKTYPELYPDSAAEDPDDDLEEELENDASENSDAKQLAEEKS